MVSESHSEQDVLFHSHAEQRLLHALSRLRFNQPLSELLKIEAAHGIVRVNVKNVCLEAGFARSYPYKNKAALPLFWSALASAKGEGKRQGNNARKRIHSTTAEIFRRDRDLAIDTAGRLLQEMSRMRSEMSDIQRLAAQSNWDAVARRLRKWR